MLSDIYCIVNGIQINYIFHKFFKLLSYRQLFISSKSLNTIDMSFLKVAIDFTVILIFNSHIRT